MRYACGVCLVGAFLGVAFAASSAAAQFDRLARHVPASANGAAFINVGKLLESPIAKKEKWAEKRDNAFASGVSFLPPDSTHAVLAMQLDLQMWLALWQVAILELDHDPNMKDIEAMTGGSPDSVVGRDAVALPGDAFVVKLNRSSAALMAPANRQSVARWMREVDSRQGVGLSPYLREAYGYASEVGTPVILALDLEDALPAEAIRAQLQESKDVLDRQKVDLEKMVALLTALRGVTLGITFSEKVFGKLKVDFSQEVSLPPDSAKALLLYALGNHGAMIDEFEEWRPAVSGKQLTLEGYLSESGMRRLASLFDRPPSLRAKEPGPQDAPQSKEQLTLAATQAYFRRVTELLDDLAKKPKDNPTAQIPQIGVWMDTYAKKIDKLSILNVDPEMVAFGGFASDSLRAAYNAIRQGSANKRIRQVNTPMQYNYYSFGNTYGYTYRENYYGAGYVPQGTYGTVAVPDMSAYQHERTRIKTEERVTSANSARDIMQNLQQATAEVRKKMTTKYQVDF